MRATLLARLIHLDLIVPIISGKEDKLETPIVQLYPASFHFLINLKFSVIINCIYIPGFNRTSPYLLRNKPRFCFRCVIRVYK